MSGPVVRYRFEYRFLKVLKDGSPVEKRNEMGNAGWRLHTVDWRSGGEVWMLFERCVDTRTNETVIFQPIGGRLLDLETREE